MTAGVTLEPKGKVLTGNHAVSFGALLSRVQVISAYPITPQTQIVELLSKFCNRQTLQARFIKVESEHSAMAALVGAASTGARCFTATSSHGLALMHEMLHWAAGARLPIVMANVNRSMGPPWSIWTDQNDSLSQRDTGWLQIYCESNQEVLDTMIQAFRIAETIQLPVMLVLDAFVLSHTAEPVEIPAQETVDRYLPPRRADFKLDPADPHSFGALAMPDTYMEFRLKAQQAMDQGLKEAERADLEFGRQFGRSYGVIDSYRTDPAELTLITSSTITSTARQVIDEMRNEGHAVGLVKVRLFRPFPVWPLRRALAGTSRVAVIDRNIGFGSGGIFAQEIKAALYGHLQIPIYSYIAGLGGRDVTPDTIREVISRSNKPGKPAERPVWLGVRR